MSNGDLLKHTLSFNLSPPLVSDTIQSKIFQCVTHGQLSDLVSLLSSVTEKEKEHMLNIPDQNGRTPLFHSCYYNYKNMTLWLIANGAQPELEDFEQNTIFHVCGARGNFDALEMIISYIYFDLREYCDETLHKLKLEFGMKQSYVKQGILVSPDKHIHDVQTRFKSYLEGIHQLYIDYLSRMLNLHALMLLNLKNVHNRTALHYSSMGIYQKCTELMLNISEDRSMDNFDRTFGELQNLEVNKDKRIHPSRTIHTIEAIRSFIDPTYLNILHRNHKRDANNLIQTAINLQDVDGYTPLHLASFYGIYQLVVQFVGYGCDTKIKDLVHNKEAIEFSQNKYIMRAISGINQTVLDNDQRKFEFLLNSGFDIEEKATIRALRPIHNSVTTAHYKAEDGGGKTQNKDSISSDALLKLINKCGGEIDAPDADGWTPLHHAAKLGDSETLLFLLENKANFNSFSNLGSHPMHVAALYDRPEIISILVSYGASPDPIDHHKCTPLHIAAKKGNLDSVHTLLENGAKLYSRDFRKWSALHYASFFGNGRVIRMLCEYDDDYNKLQSFKNSQGKTAKEISKSQKIKKYFETICGAARAGKLDSVRNLVTLGHNLNTSTRVKHYTPCILAAINGHLLVVRYLLEHGADAKKVDSNGKRALDYAIERLDDKLIGIIKDFDDGVEEQENNDKAKQSQMEEVPEENEKSKDGFDEI